jgi:protocatechuate 3,4-dioxygenase beta subunit
VEDEHEGQRVSRRRLIAGISSIGLGSLLAACGDGGSGNVSGSGGAGFPTATAGAGATTSADLTGLFANAGTCKLTSSATQGPYYFDADKIRSDIREDRAGKRLRLAIKVTDSERCAAIPNAAVEIWHCDAGGLYSGAEAQSTGGQGGPGGAPGGGPQGGGSSDLTPTDDKRYLRGAQVTNADGIVQFTTIWPGWYRGRTVHIHAMVHLSNSRVLTTQLMFDEALNSAVLAQQPYAARTGRDTFNDSDSIFRQDMLLAVTPERDGYLGVTVFGVDSDKDGS